MENIKHKYIFHFYKRGWLIFISHLNLMRLFERAFLRSSLPVAYSQGFNPHLRLSLPFPLSLGFAGEQEIGEVYLDQKVSMIEFQTRLNKYLPTDIQITAVAYKNIKSLSQLVDAYYYRILFKPSYEHDSLKRYLQQKELIIEKVSKTGRVTALNLFDYLKEYAFKKNELSFTLMVKDQRTIDVNQLLKALAIDLSSIEDIVREKISCAGV